MDGTDRQLLDAALADREQFAAIVKRTEGMVYGLALSFFRSRAIAEDLVQDVYLQLFRNLDRLESDMHVVNWLRQTMTRKCIDHSRRKKNQPHLHLDDAPESSDSPHLADPLCAQELRREIAKLPPKMRVVVILRFQNDMRLVEIAKTTGIPLNTVKTLLRRALIRLRPRVAHLRPEVSLATAGRSV